MGQGLFLRARCHSFEVPLLCPHEWAYLRDTEHVLLFSLPLVPSTSEVLHTISPSSGPNVGGTLVTLSGSGFFDSPDAMCRFGEYGYEVFARFTSVATFECTSPLHASAIVPVEISLNGQQFTSGMERLFEFQATLIVHSLSPPQGPVLGGTPIFLTGAYFQQRTNAPALCRFYKTTTLATVISKTLIKCRAPAVGHSGYLPVEVTTNLQDFTACSIQFLYVAVTMSSVHPLHVSQLGGTEITINGRNFYAPTRQQAWCTFGSAGPSVAIWE